MSAAAAVNLDKSVAFLPYKLIQAKFAWRLLQSALCLQQTPLEQSPCASHALLPAAKLGSDRHFTSANGSAWYCNHANSRYGMPTYLQFQRNATHWSPLDSLHHMLHYHHAVRIIFGQAASQSCKAFVSLCFLTVVNPAILFLSLLVWITATSSATRLLVWKSRVSLL